MTLSVNISLPLGLGGDHVSTWIRHERNPEMIVVEADTKPEVCAVRTKAAWPARDKWGEPIVGSPHRIYRVTFSNC